MRAQSMARAKHLLPQLDARGRQIFLEVVAPGTADVYQRLLTARDLRAVDIAKALGISGATCRRHLRRLYRYGLAAPTNNPGVTKALTWAVL